MGVLSLGFIPSSVNQGSWNLTHSLKWIEFTTKSKIELYMTNFFVSRRHSQTLVTNKPRVRPFSMVAQNLARLGRKLVQNFTFSC